MKGEKREVKYFEVVVGGDNQARLTMHEEDNAPDKDQRYNANAVIRALIAILGEAEKMDHGDIEDGDGNGISEEWDSYDLEIPGNLADLLRSTYDVITPCCKPDEPGKTFDDLVLTCLHLGLMNFLGDAIARILAYKVAHDVEEKLKNDFKNGSVKIEDLKDIRLHVVDRDDLTQILGGLSDGLHDSSDEKSEGHRKVHTQDGYC